jgi:transcriptional regulator with XRE-family HTH domain
MGQPIEMGAYIRKLRRERGMTQAEMAAGLHVTPQAVSKWERGASLPDVALLPDLAELLDVGLDVLLNPGRPSDIGGALRRLGRLVDQELFAHLLAALPKAGLGQGPQFPYELLLLLSPVQQDTFTNALLALEAYPSLAPDLFPYLGPGQRAAVARHALGRRDFPLLERLLPCMSPALRLEALARAVEWGRYTFAESVLAFLPPEQRAKAAALSARVLEVQYEEEEYHE